MDLRTGETARDRLAKGEMVRVADPVSRHQREGQVTGFGRDGRSVYVRFIGLRAAVRYWIGFVFTAPTRATTTEGGTEE